MSQITAFGLLGVPVLLVTGRTDGAVTDDLFTLTLVDDTSIAIEALVIGSATDYSESFGGKMTGAAHLPAGGVASFFNRTNAVDGANVAIKARFKTNGSDIILRVTGAAGVIYNWRAFITYIIETRTT